jgi:hypothetical protein
VEYEILPKLQANAADILELHCAQKNGVKSKLFLRLASICFPPRCSQARRPTREGELRLRCHPYGRFPQSSGITLAGRRELDDALSNQFDCGIGTVNEPQFSKRGIEHLRENLYVLRSERRPL